ncbi:MAG: hypothetical protein K0S56_1515 [Microvirga sp.]|nr:hypothetical protein [Microvirga sp.]
MATAWAASPFETRKGRTATVRPPAIHFNGTSNDSCNGRPAQYLGPAPRIVATHWLRLEADEGGISEADAPHLMGGGHG